MIAGKVCALEQSFPINATQLCESHVFCEIFSYLGGTYFAFLGGCMPSRWPAKYPHNRRICFACHFSARGWHVFFAIAYAVLAPASFTVGKSDPVPVDGCVPEGLLAQCRNHQYPPNCMLFSSYVGGTYFVTGREVSRCADARHAIRNLCPVH